MSVIEVEAVGEEFWTAGGCDEQAWGVTVGEDVKGVDIGV